MISFFVSGTPKPQPRPRAYVRGGHAGVYDCGTANGWKYLVAVRAHETIRALTEASPMLADKPIALYIDLFLPRPKSHYYQTKSRNGQLREDAPIWHTSKPDADNFAKAVMDALGDSRLVWSDDAQVCFLQTTKQYANTPDEIGARVRIDVMPKGE